MVNVALWGLKQIYKPNYNYAKAGVMLGELVPIAGVRADLFSKIQASPKSSELMSTMNNINCEMGKDAIKLASEAFSRPWRMRQENKTPAYTTGWKDLILSQ